ncbi:polysaccharide deacetylase family protein [Pontibacter chinhatensis]|uniref:Polysaccharide deacetylase n=1 Tax=Pontibacter chinhatensis TaxID=1436961 RepID=A0A1I2N2Q1_9BACT|nr:polysaccharide deacetylase family protein [Pontibacter chinhatensis]SFF97129.1 Polysaccharide deacetylase [Pontibacter chinhatensis]
MKLTLRNISGWLLACILIRLGYVRKALNRTLKGEQILSVYFHNPTRKEFESSVQWLQKQGLNFLSIADLERIVHKRSDFPKGGAIITVDDGWQANEKNIVETAEAYKVPVAIFVSTQPVQDGAYWWSYLEAAKKAGLSPPAVQALKDLPNEERLLKLEEYKRTIHLPREAMTVGQVQRLSRSKYITIGGHTHSHPILTNCEDDQVYFELRHSKRTLESWTGKLISYFTYPNGNFSGREVQALEGLDYSIAFTCEPKPIRVLDTQHRYLLPRLGFLEGASFAENMCRMTGVWQAAMQRFRAPLRKKRRIPTDIGTTPVATKDVAFQ